MEKKVLVSPQPSCCATLTGLLRHLNGSTMAWGSHCIGAMRASSAVGCPYMAKPKRSTTEDQTEVQKRMEQFRRILSPHVLRSKNWISFVIYFRKSFQVKKACQGLLALCKIWKLMRNCVITHKFYVFFFVFVFFWWNKGLITSDAVKHFALPIWFFNMS